MKNAKLTIPGTRGKAPELRLRDRYEGLKHYLELETVEIWPNEDTYLNAKACEQAGIERS